MADFDGRYRRERLLGAGGMGEVWLAFDEELGDRPVAIKMMHSRMLTEADDAARFQREMRLASRMQHPNILTVYTTGTDNGVPYMVMEYLVGRDLSKVPPGLDIGQVTRIGRETCAALACAHGLDVVHRDIKPGNLFLCDNGLTKVTDFGIAKAISGTKLSATGMLIGTLAYMAPEHWLGQPAAFSNDIWAVGCVLYELLSGRLPREYAAPMDYVAAAARRDRVVSLELIADVPAWLGTAVMAMLSPDPADRPTAADGVQLLAGPPAQAAPVPARPASAPPLGVPPGRPVVRASRPPGGPATAPGISHPPTSPVRAPRPATPGRPRPRPKMRVGVLVPVAAGVVAAGVIAALVALPGGPQRAVARGSIVTADGVTIATTKPSSDQYKYQRVYPDGSPYAPVTGYDTIGTRPQSANAAGLERAENSLLAGGKTVELTVNSQVQAVAYQQLQTVLRGELSNGKQAVGGVVALNPSTGAILALASYPSYDPNQLATHNAAALSAADKLLTSENPSPLLNNATQTPLPAGSTFSIVTSSAWYNQDAVRNPVVQVASPQPLTLPNGNTLSNDNGEICGAGSPTTPVIYAFAQSCNTPFAELGVKLGGQAIKSMATNYGLNNPSALNIAGVTVVPSNFTAESDSSFTAFDAIGVHDTTVTPLQEAMFAATVANKGVLMRPYLIQQVQASGSVADQARPQRLSQPISATIAGYEKQMMIAVVQQPEGTGYAFNQNNEGGLIIAGKTGTAQNGISATPDAVFVAFAPAENPRIAVGVIIAGGGYGAAAAAPVAVAVIRTYLATLGDL